MASLPSKEVAADCPDGRSIEGLTRRRGGCSMLVGGVRVARSLFEKYGGFGKVSKIVLAFYDKVLDSENLADYFEDIDMRRQIDHQTKFISSLMGGPASFSNQHLQEVHAHLGVDRRSFEELTSLLEETLEDFDLDPPDVDRIMVEVRGRAGFIVTGD
jgi:hemoglobin